MGTLQISSIIEKDGELHLHNLPYKKGSRVILAIKPETTDNGRRKFTARDLLESDLVGMWEARTDIPEDSSQFARILRERAQRQSIEL